MRPAEHIKRLVKKLNDTTNDEMDERVLADVLGALAESEESSALTRPKIWRTLMKSPMTRIAAVAVIAVAVLISISEFGGSATSVVWGEVFEKVEQIPALSFDMTVEITYPDGEKFVLPSENYVAGDYGTRSDVYVDGTLSMIKFRLPTKKVAYQVRIDQKKYWRLELSDEQAGKGRDPDDPRTWLKMILSGDYTELGRADINGVAVEGIECSRPEMTGESGVMRLWVDVKTNLPVRIEIEMLGMEGGQMRPHKYLMDDFQWNVELDESVFEPNIPADYTLMEN